MSIDKAATAGGGGNWPGNLLAVRKRPNRRSRGGAFARLKTVSPYFLTMAILAITLALIAAPLSGALVQRWSGADVQARSRLIHRSIGASLARAAQSGDWQRVDRIFTDVAQDERVLALGLCDPTGRLRSATAGMPAGVSRDAEPKEEGFARETQNGKPISVGVFPVQGGGQADRLVILQDLSFISSRSGQAQGRAFAVLILMAAIIVGVAVFLVHLISRKWIESLREAVAYTEGSRPDAGQLAPANGDFMGVEIRRVIREFEAGRASIEAQDVDWSPASLQGVMKEALPGAEVLVLANREPYIHNYGPGWKITLQTPASGLVSALEPVMRATGGCWIAHGSGSADRDTVDASDSVAVPPDAPSYRLRRIWISEEEQDGYYYGFAN